MLPHLTATDALVVDEEVHEVLTALADTECNG
jgi:hypothetical protein